MSRRPQVAGHRSQAAGQRICLLFSVLCLLFSVTGCQALVRKFTRKPKGEPKKEEPIFQPQEYPEVAQAIDQLYKDYFLFWENWADELLSHLSKDANFKKQKECAGQALDNLKKMQSILNEEKAKALQPWVSEFTAVRDAIFSGGLNSVSIYSLQHKVERIKSRVHRDFVYSKVREDLK